ncbi:unnamed protein product [Ilex paraguariensis]|uniref:Cytosol aminopeptidase domain-containing protein n=1 Tax=Ilex paraguariensis TaxID=185542 RepID=A0ABC8TM03_9AQUA
MFSQTQYETGIFTPSDDLAKEVLAASVVAGEKLWRMPLEESYWESMKSGVADMVNTGGRPGGAITAALFLKQVERLSIFFLFAFNYTKCWKSPTSFRIEMPDIGVRLHQFTW